MIKALLGPTQNFEGDLVLYRNGLSFIIYDASCTGLFWTLYSKKSKYPNCGLGLFCHKKQPIFLYPKWQSPVISWLGFI